MRNQELAFGVAGQSLVFDCPEGRPSSVTSFKVYDAGTDDDGTEEADLPSGSAAIETNPNTTVDVASGVGNLSDRTRINLTDTTGVTRGRDYLLTNTLGQKEWVEVKDIATAEYVRSRVPLTNAYAVDSTFQSTRISLAVATAWVSDESHITGEWCAGSPGYRARVEYVVDGVTYVHHFYVDLLRYPLQRLVSPLDVDRRFPGWINSLPVDYREDQGAALLQTACDALVMDALGDAKELRAVRETRVLRELVLCRAMLCAAEANALNGATRPDALETAQKIYTQRYNQLLREPKVPMDGGSGGAGTTAQRAPIWRR